MSNNRQQILAALVAVTLVLSLATIALTTDDAMAGQKKNKKPCGSNPLDSCGGSQNDKGLSGQTNKGDNTKKEFDVAIGSNGGDGKSAKYKIGFGENGGKGEGTDGTNGGDNNGPDGTDGNPGDGTDGDSVNQNGKDGKDGEDDCSGQCGD
jgi:hypothetical protein